MRLAAALVAASLSVAGTALASPVDGPLQDLTDFPEVAAGRAYVTTIRMAPLERWTAEFVAEEDDAELACAAKDASGHQVDVDFTAGDRCVLKGVTGKRTEAVTFTVFERKKRVMHLGYTID